MAKVLKVPTGDDAVVYFEVDEVPVAGPEQVSRGGHIMAELDARLADALATVGPAAESIVDALAGLNPSEIKVEFGLKLDATLGAVIAKTGLSGHFTVTLTLRRPATTGSAGGV